MDIKALAKNSGMVIEQNGTVSCVWHEGLTAVSVDDLGRFAQLVAAKERERWHVGLSAVDTEKSMGYWQRWEGSADPDDKSGIAHFVVDGVRYSLRLPKFEDCNVIDNLLEAAFKQGKKFAEDALNSHIHNAIDRAREGHAL